MITVTTLSGDNSQRLAYATWADAREAILADLELECHPAEMPYWREGLAKPPWSFTTADLQIIARAE